MSTSSIIYRILLFIFVYNFVFPIKLNAFIMTDELILLSVLIIAYFKNAFQYVFYSKFIRYFGFISVILFFLGGVSYLYNYSIDIIPVIQGLKLIFIVLFAFLISYLFIIEYQSESIFSLVKVLVLSGFLVSLSSIAEYLSPEFKQILSVLIDTSGNIDYSESFRVHGFAASGGASLSVSIFLIYVLSFTINYNGFIKGIGWFCIITVLLLSTICIGRTGLYFALIFTLINFLVNFNFKKIIYLTVLLFIVSFLFNNEFDVIDPDKLNLIYEYSFELIKNYIETGDITTKSSSHLLDMFYLPGWQHIIFGAGYWRYPTHGYSLSDIGYIKLLMAYGFLGMILVIAVYVYIFGHAYAIVVKMYGNRFFYFVFFSSLFVAEFKEEFFMQNYSIKVVLLLSAMLYIKMEINNKNRLKTNTSSNVY